MINSEIHLQYGIVAIGRNEGDRLKICIGSALRGIPIVYVDSGSTDGSVRWTKGQGVDVVELDLTEGFTAARARNAGFTRLMELRPGLEYVQFVDGDCELAKGWTEFAVGFLDAHPDACAAFGRRRERRPDQSIYNEICDREWNVPLGEARFFGGDVMIRRSAFAMAGGYRDEMIAGEEPELSVRMRGQGWSIWRLDCEMSLHDASITRFSQWWLRMVRSGYAFALGRNLHGYSSERLWVWECRRAWIWGIWIPLGCLIGPALAGPLAFALVLIYPLWILRRAFRLRGSRSTRVYLALFETAGRFAEAVGQLKFILDRLMRRRGRLVEYK